ncbi:MAG: HAMP domain-containing protein [Sphingomonadales bacterium]|nr:HAMP domain-containing protein [Sphingomonadales bacterium]MDE2569982.1 HAMP domain-containing protein [Sphingomonadales bacterium]
MTAALPESTRRWPRWWRRLLVALRRANIFLVLELASALVLATMLTVSWMALTNSHTASSLLPSRITSSLLIGTLVPAMALIVLIGRRMALRRAARSVAGTNGRFHTRLVWLFSLIAAVPTLLVVVFASLLFQSGVDFWFSDNSRSILQNANELARGFYEQNLRDVENEAVAMAGDMRDYLNQASITSPDFAEGYSWQVVSRKLSESAVLRRNPDNSFITLAIVDPRKNDNRQRITPDEVKRLDEGETAVVEVNGTRIEAVTPIDRGQGVYLYVARSDYNPLMLNQSKRAQSVVKAYTTLTEQARALQLRFNIALFTVSLALVGLAVWAALRFADRQVAPLAELLSASRDVGAGNFAVRVPHQGGADEIGLLSRAFNRMTMQIEGQTLALVNANRKLGERSTFIEAVVESITAGIVSVDRDGVVLLMNSSAKKLLLDEGVDEPAPGMTLSEVAPQFAQLVSAGQKNGVIQYAQGGDLLTLAVKIVTDPDGQVITFEDITRQLLDQRRAAWSDVARRIAHEIKNPLTPIQLATERLRRRYGKQITADPELFDELTSTIVRQVGDLRKMVDEFSSFARMPKPVFRAEDAADLVRQALFLQEVGHSDITYSWQGEAGPVAVQCDRHQFGQAMTNVLKNAAEAVESRAARAEIDYRGRIAVSLSADDEVVTVVVEDNGVGLPADRDRILEPYMTTREKGTGLGLAIVHKIVEEHGGDMTFSAAEGGGTRVTMHFARDPVASMAEPGEGAAEAAE